MNIGRGLPGSATADPGQDREHDTTDNNVNTSTRTGTSGTSTVKNAVRGIRSFFSRAHNAGKYYLPWVFDRRPLPLESGSPPLIDINTPDTLYKTVDGKYFSFVRDEEMEAEAPEYNNRPIPSFNDVMLSPLVPSSSRDYMAMVHQRSKGEIPNADTHWYGFVRGHILYDKDMSRSELIKLSDALTILEAHPGMVDQDMSQMLKEKKRAFVIKRNERLPELYEKDQLSVGVPPLIPVDLMKGAVSDSVLEYCDGGGKPGFGANSKLLFLIASRHARFNPATGLMEFCERKDESKYRTRKSAIKPRYIKITKPDPNPENIQSRKLKSFLERNYLMCCGAGYACGIVGGGFSAFVLDWFSNEEQLTNRRLRMNAAMNAASKVGSRCGISLAFLAMGFEFVSRDIGLVLPDNREWNHKYGYATAVGTTMAIFQLRVGPRAAVVGGIISFGATVLATKLRDWYLVRRMENHPVIRRVAKMIKDADPVKMQEAVEKAKQYKNPLFVTRPHIDPFPTKAHA